MICDDGFDPGQSGVVEGVEKQKKKIKKKEMTRCETERDLLRFRNDVLLFSHISVCAYNLFFVHITFSLFLSNKKILFLLFECAGEVLPHVRKQNRRSSIAIKIQIRG